MERPQHVTAMNLAAARPDLVASIRSKVYFAAPFLGLPYFPGVMLWNLEFRYL
jgi:hypothetical protein